MAKAGRRSIARSTVVVQGVKYPIALRFFAFFSFFSAFFATQKIFSEGKNQKKFSEGKNQKILLRKTFKVMGKGGR